MFTTCPSLVMIARSNIRKKALCVRLSVLRPRDISFQPFKTMRIPYLRHNNGIFVLRKKNFSRNRNRTAIQTTETSKHATIIVIDDGTRRTLTYLRRVIVSAKIVILVTRTTTTTISSFRNIRPIMVCMLQMTFL